MYVVNQNIAKTYRSGYLEGRNNYLRLDLNENPGGLPQDFIDDVLANVTPEFVSQYPEMAEFTRQYAAYLGVQPENLCLTNGSTEAIRYVIEGFTSPGGTVVGVTPSYAMYEVYCSMYGRNYVAVHYNHELEISPDDIIAALTPEVELLILLNPNNPIGDAYSEHDMECIMSAARKNEVAVLIDEAYYYFYPHTFMQYALEQKRVFVTRTFSKLFSLAGCRLGCVIGQPEDIEIVQKLCVPHNVNAFAIRFAQALLNRPDVVQHLIDANNNGKAYFEHELDTRGYTYLHSEGNFMFFKSRTNPDVLVRRMQDEKGILIKSYHGIGYLGDCVRVTIAEQKYMKRLADALDELDKE